MERRAAIAPSFLAATGVMDVCAVGCVTAMADACPTDNPHELHTSSVSVPIPHPVESEVHVHHMAGKLAKALGLSAYEMYVLTKNATYVGRRGSRL